MRGVVLVLALAWASPTAAATITVNSGGDLQAALNAAVPGDEIVVEAGATFTGNFTLPVKSFGAAITIRSSATLPNRRITVADASLLPLIAPGNADPPLIGGTGVANWRLDGLQFGSTTGGNGEVLRMAGSDSIYMDRILIVAGVEGQKRGIQANGTNITLTRSHIANIWMLGVESQAFCAWDGAGPYTVTDNYLEAASINILFGGANSSSVGNIPQDILVDGNHMSKQTSWLGEGKVVKNLFELKQAKRVTITNNLFEHNWSDGQSGTAIVFTTRNDEGGSPWAVVEDVLFERNTVRNTEGIINILGYENTSGHTSGQATRITIQHNYLSGTGFFLQAGGEVGTVTIQHNTINQGGNLMTLYLGDVDPTGGDGLRAGLFAISNLTYINNLAYHREYGVFGGSIGTSALEAMTETYTWTHNVLAGGNEAYVYPSVTWRPTEEDHAAQFDGDSHLIPGSTYRNAGNDGLDLGVVDTSVSVPRMRLRIRREDP